MNQFKQTTAQGSPKETIEQGSEGLAPIARLILEKGFRNPTFHILYEEIQTTSNRLFGGETVPNEEVDAILAKIDEHKDQIAESDMYDEEVRDIMRNYFLKLSQNLKAAQIKAQRPENLEQLKAA